LKKKNGGVERETVSVICQKEKLGIH
jgi:hypothetical protein